MISLQVKYKSQSFLTGDVIAVRPIGFEYSEGDCKKAWLASGRSAKEYKNTFAIIYISDCKDANHKGLIKLTEAYSDDPDSAFKRKYYIEMPVDFEDSHRVSIRTSGETIATLAEVIALTKVR